MAVISCFTSEKQHGDVEKNTFHRLVSPVCLIGHTKKLESVCAVIIRKKMPQNDQYRVKYVCRSVRACWKKIYGDRS